MAQPKTKNKWTSAERKELGRLFRVSSSEELIAAFPRHPIGSIKSTARDMGLKRPYGYRKWAAMVRNHVPVFGFARVVYD